MKAKVKATLYIPHSGKLYKFGEEIDVDETTMRTYPDHFEPLAQKTAPAPENKMVTNEKETVKATPVKMKLGPKTSRMRKK